MNKDEIYHAVEDNSWFEADKRAKYYSRLGVPKIMPDKYQATTYRKIKECIFVIDDFLDKSLLENLKKYSFIVNKKEKGWSRQINVINDQLIADNKQLGETSLSDKERSILEESIDQALQRVHEKILLLTYSNAIVKYNTWINTGSIIANDDQEDFHFWHYDSDEYMEFCMIQDWLRFPIWGAIFYINQPKNQQHFTVFDDTKINQQIRALSNRLVIFDPSYMHKVIGARTSDDTDDTRLVMVFNAWDYHALDHGISIRPYMLEKK